MIATFATYVCAPTYFHATKLMIFLDSHHEAEINWYTIFMAISET